MPSTPYAASTAATPIASAKRPKRRANQAGSNDVRRADANSTAKSEETTTIATPATPPSAGKGAASSTAGDGASTSTTPLGKRAEEGAAGGDAGEGGPEAPSPTKARKGSSSATPRTSGLCTDSRRQPQEQPQNQEQGKGRASSGGGAGKGEGRVQGLEGERSQDQNRHKPKESSIFSPALHQSQEEARDQAPASTVGAAAAAAAAAAQKHGVPDGTADALASTSPSSSVVEPLSKKGRTSCDSSSGHDAGEEGDASPPAPAPAPGETGAEGGAAKTEEQPPAGSGDDDDLTPPGLAIREVEGGVDGVAEGEEEEEDEEEFNPYCFIAHLPPYNTVKHHTPEAPVLPEKRKTRHGKELTLVLDLDETLVHCTVDPIVNPDHRFEVHFNGEEFQVYVRKRPHLDAFLEAVSELFEVVVFTASQQVYAERLLNMIDPQKKFVKYRLYRDACMALEGNYLKDLNVLGRDLSKVAIVDNSPYAYGFQIDNGIPIESWFDDRNDEELLHLLPLLKQLINESETAGGDVRPFIRSIFKTHELVDKARNGDRDVGSSMHYPALATAASSEETDKEQKGEAGSTASAVGGGGGESAGGESSATTTAAVQ
eukprot:g9606.t1